MNNLKVTSEVNIFVAQLLQAQVTKIVSAERSPSTGTYY